MKQRGKGFDVDRLFEQAVWSEVWMNADPKIWVITIGEIAIFAGSAWSLSPFSRFGEHEHWAPQLARPCSAHS